jgi:hypothetical protein
MTMRVTELHNKRGGYTRYSRALKLRSIYHPERRDYDVAKWSSKQTLEKRKTSLSLMEVFNIALKCFSTARGCSYNSMVCDVARHEPYRVCMGLYWPKN